MLIACITYAQEKQNTFYFKKNGKQVQEKDSADYIRTISPSDPGETHYKLVEHYKDGTIKTTGRTSSPKGVKYEGEIITFFDNGKRESFKTYVDNKLMGYAYEYFNNGELKYHRLYVVPTAKSDSLETNYQVLQVGDSTGRKFLDGKGNGFLEYKNNSLVERGGYKNGFKDGLWKVENLKTNATYEEIYANGVFKSGTYKLANGETGSYTIQKQLPAFKGGSNAFWGFLSDNLKYPSEDRNARIQGRVLLKFVVEEDGSLTNFKVIQTPSESLAEEAIRVLQKSQKWEPGIERGKPVKVNFTMPILFQLSK
jgi:TonB family protein